MIRTAYHTQEKREQPLQQPCICYRDDAWLGEGYYFWLDLSDAEYWGDTSKRRTGRYVIYRAEIDYTHVLDTVFNEEHYYFWLHQIEKVALKMTKTAHVKPTLKELNDYFKERGTWDEVAGIQFQDLPASEHYSLVFINRKERPSMFAYKKRIQVVVFDTEIINNFALLKEENCSL